LSNLPTNVRLYWGWFLEIETPVMAAAVLFFLAPGVTAPSVRHARFLLGGMAAVVVASYLFYLTFDSWTYLRFFLPVWPVLMLLTAGVVLSLLRRMGAWFPLAALICAGLVTWQSISISSRYDVFSLWQRERRFADVARFISAHTDPQAVIISMLHSGSIYLYTGRPTLRYERLDQPWLDPAVDHLASTGRHPYIVLDATEVDDFRKRFAGRSRLASLDWMPVAALADQVYIYDALPTERAIQPEVIPSAIGDADFCYRPSMP
jgi:hypothetical protein